VETLIVGRQDLPMSSVVMLNMVWWETPLAGIKFIRMKSAVYQKQRLRRLIPPFITNLSGSIEKVQSFESGGRPNKSRTLENYLTVKSSGAGH